MWEEFQKTLLGQQQQNMTPIITNNAGQMTAVPNAGTFWDSSKLTGEPSLWEKVVGYKNADGTAVNGFGGITLGALSGLGNLFMGMQNYGLAQDQLKFQKDAYNKNYAAQTKTLNTQMEDRQAARIAANPTAFASVSDYMAKNRIV